MFRQVPAGQQPARVEYKRIYTYKETSLTPPLVGSFALVLHSHIPYVLAHGRSPHGTDWLSEVAAETYIPLLDTLFRLVEEGI